MYIRIYICTYLVLTYAFVYAHVVYTNIHRTRIIGFISLKPAKTMENKK